MSIPQKDGVESPSEPPKQIDVRRIRLLWIGFATYSLIMLNSIRYVYSLPYQLVILGALVNGAIILAFIFELKRTYKRLGKQ